MSICSGFAWSGYSDSKFSSIETLWKWCKRTFSRVKEFVIDVMHSVCHYISLVHNYGLVQLSIRTIICCGRIKQIKLKICFNRFSKDINQSNLKQKRIWRVVNVELFNNYLVIRSYLLEIYITQNRLPVCLVSEFIFKIFTVTRWKAKISGISLN